MGLMPYEPIIEPYSPSSLRISQPDQEKHNDTIKPRVLVLGQGHSAIDDVFRQVKEEYDDKMMRVGTGHSVQSDWCRYRMKGSNRTLVKLHYDMVIDVKTYKDAFRKDFKHDGDSCETHSVVSPSANRRKRIASKSDESRWPLEIPYQIEKGFGMIVLDEI
ncbi:uncharacterized protein LOC127851116 [Dreissena polymorpha]|uniref:uncharacterized protein LOC127851116 n=1 Tax=Dreissena polymorpha TaxID=45954 RepID=UPI002264516A|nr:uncharacterized protein LOC127851116 [Dreissena polymorpha]